MRWERISNSEEVLVDDDGRILAKIIKHYGKDIWNTPVGDFYGLVAAQRAVKHYIRLGHLLNEKEQS